MSNKFLFSVCLAIAAVAILFPEIVMAVDNAKFAELNLKEITGRGDSVQNFIWGYGLKFVFGAGFAFTIARAVFHHQLMPVVVVFFLAIIVAGFQHFINSSFTMLLP